MAPVVGLVCGDPGAFGQVLTDSARLCSRWFPVPYGRARMSEVHLHVGCQGERGMTGASPNPDPEVKEPRITSGMVSVVIDQRHHTNPQVFLPQRVEPESSTDPGGALYQGRCR